MEFIVAVLYKAVLGLRWGTCSDLDYFSNYNKNVL